MAEYSDRKDRTITTRWQITGDLAKYILSQELTHLDDWGGKEVVRDILPEVFQKNFDMIQTDLINCILEEKNKQTEENGGDTQCPRPLAGLHATVVEKHHQRDEEVDEVEFLVQAL